VRRKGEDAGTVIQAFPLHRGRTMAVTLAVAIPMFDSVYETILKAALTAATDLPPWPEVPADYATSTKRGLTYAVHPSVTGSIRHFQDVSQATQKNFEKFHGKLPRIARDSPPPVIFIHSSSDQAAAISPDLKGDTRPFLSETTTMRFFATPIQEDDAKGSHDLASAFGQFLIQRRYGTTIPRWVMVGEINVAGVEHDTGKRLPWIAPGHVAWASGIELPRLDKYQPGNEETVPQVCFFYVAFFHAGGSKYKKAYRAFLDDIATHYDADAAAKRHLEPLGYDKIQAAANKFMHTGFKVAKG
jgi:hypothetical protein